MRAELQPSRAEPHAAGASVDADALGDFRVADLHERVALLNDLRDHATPVLLHAPDGHALRSTVWAVDGAARRVAFAVGGAELAAPYLEPLLEAEEVTAVAHSGAAKLQFSVSGLVLVRGQASAVLQAAWPEDVQRIQRRENFRVCPPVAAPVAYLRHPSIPEMSLALRVLDVSLGGCALRLPDDVPAVQPGIRISGATIELDLDTRLRAELTLQHITRLGSGAGAVRLGCEWHLARREDERVLQRWIDQAQVRQRFAERAAGKLAGTGDSTAGASRPAHHG